MDTPDATPSKPSQDPTAADMAQFEPLTDWLRKFEQDLRADIAKERRRADRAERKLKALNAEMATARVEAAEETRRLIEAAHVEADQIREAALTDAERAKREAARRERSLLVALRGYLEGIGDAQDALLGVARQALGVSYRGFGQSSASRPFPKRSADLGGQPLARHSHSNGAAASADWFDEDEVTDEHRLIDLHNRLDMGRLDSARYSWGKMRRRSTEEAPTRLPTFGVLVPRRA